MAEPEQTVDHRFAGCSNADLTFIVRHIMQHMIGGPMMITDERCDIINGASCEIVARASRLDDGSGRVDGGDH